MRPVRGGLIRRRAIPASASLRTASLKPSWPNQTAMIDAGRFRKQNESGLTACITSRWGKLPVAGTSPGACSQRDAVRKGKLECEFAPTWTLRSSSFSCTSTRAATTRNDIPFGAIADDITPAESRFFHTNPEIWLGSTLGGGVQHPFLGPPAQVAQAREGCPWPRVLPRPARLCYQR